MEAEKVNILVVEDNPQFIQLLQIYLKKAGYGIWLANNGQEAMQILSDHIPDLIISDIMMPEMDGWAFRHRVLQDPELRMIPFIFLTAKDTTEERIAGFKLTVDDYIPKPFEPRELIVRIQAILDKHKLYSDLIKYDSMTNLYNRRTIEVMLQKEIKRTLRYNLSLSVLLLDIDHFKYWNDQFGHPYGDYVIRLVAEKLIGTFRDVDFAGRLGGDEFIVAMPETDRDAAFQVAERLRRELRGIKLEKSENPINISAGIASIPVDADDYTELMNKADKALYDAKKMGRNRVVLFNAAGPGESTGI